MAASTTDKITNTASTSTARPQPTQVTSSRSAGIFTLACNSLTGWPTSTDSKVHFCTYKVNTSNAKIAGSQIDMEGIVSGTSIGSIVIRGGTDVGNAVGDIVEMAPTAAWGNDLYTGLTVEHNRNGTHNAVTAASVTASGVINASTQGNLQDGSIALQTMRSENTFDYVASGCVWTADAAGSTRLASMTAGVVYIGGKRIVVSAVTSRTFTASKDVYVDVDNTGTLVYTDGTTNAASGALAANSIRLAIVVVGASSIATAASINQGQEDRVLPIASSVPYAVTDSLGNLICPRDPNRKILGYRPIIANVSNATTTQATVVSVPVIVPATRKVKITGFIGNTSNPAVSSTINTLWEGAVVAGTQIAGTRTLHALAANSVFVHIEAVRTPASTNLTYTLGFAPDTNTETVNASSTVPTWIKVELV